MHLFATHRSLALPWFMFVLVFVLRSSSKVVFPRYAASCFYFLHIMNFLYVCVDFFSFFLSDQSRLWIWDS
uniref:Uncharacterized protein n=1 Tax=Rhizophora mucronata TaxID=61149 RepID=A0A2P2NQU5_RHIMU